MIRLRLGVSPLRTHKLRYHKDVTPVDYSCPFCESDVETEVHFILVCPKYAETRQQYVPKKYFTGPSSFKLALLLTTTSKLVLLLLAIYIMKAFSIRNAYISPTAHYRGYMYTYAFNMHACLYTYTSRIHLSRL